MRAEGPRAFTRTESFNVDQSQAEGPRTFWTGIWGMAGEFCQGGPVLKEWKQSVRSETRHKHPEKLPRDECCKDTIAKMAGWKALGPDGIHAARLRKWGMVTDSIRERLWKLIDIDEEFPEWLIRGRTFMIPKGKCTCEPHQFRPITCLNTTYKALTGNFARIVADWSEHMGIIPKEQLALKKGTRGCLNALVIDDMLGREAKRRERDMAVGWIDFQKAYDMVPHNLILEVLKMVKVPRWIRKAVAKAIPKWATDILLSNDEGDTTTLAISFKRGLFLGDALSLLLFCLCLAPLSMAINRKSDGFRSEFMEEPIIHLAYMDDVKVYTLGREELKQIVGTVEATA